MTRRGLIEVSADPVSEFYTRHPYPPPVDNLDRARDEWRDANRHRAEHHLFWPGRTVPRRSRHPRRRLRNVAGRQVRALPAQTLSSSASTSARRASSTRSKLKQKYRLTNLDLRQLPIEHVGELQRTFDLIVCTGVLHHLADPDAGLRALRSVLKPDGAMYLMVYAPYGRTGVYMLQDYCRRLGVGTSARAARSHRHPRAVAAVAPWSRLLARSARRQECRRARRCAAESARPVLFRPAAVRVHRPGRI